MRKEFHYKIPELILIISNNKKKAYLEKIFQAGLDQIKEPHVALSLYIQKKDFKNMLSAIKLMDIKGAFLDGKYEELGTLLTGKKITKSRINTICYKHNRHYGYDTLEAANRSYTKGVKAGVLTKKNPVKDNLFLAHLVAANICIWTGKAINIPKLVRSMRYIHAK